MALARLADTLDEASSN